MHYARTSLCARSCVRAGPMNHLSMHLALFFGLSVRVNFFFHGCCETRFCCPVLYEPQVGIPTAGSKEGKETRAPFVRPSSHCRVVASLSPSPPRPRVRFGQEDDALTCLALPDLALPCLALRPCLPRQLDFCLKSTLLSSCICPLHGPPFWQGRRDAHI